jgi:hypothetical protein
MPLIATPKGTAIAAPNQTDLQKRVAELEAQLAAKHAPSPLKFKVSEKGGVSVYNLNARFPVTLYADQWKRLMEASAQLLAFIDANQSRLSVK